ncbi:MAG TPA: hypothetical protein VG755_00225 [Nannocystaceae bacterium]|nr:hypothetical protein [Nannocystaceae bacterium]
MKKSPLAVALLALALGGTITTVSCVMCNDIGCIGGLEWEASPLEGGAMMPGSYDLVLELDGGSYHFDCTVTELARESECSGPADDDDDEFELSIDLTSYQTTEEWDRDAPAGKLLVQVWAFEGDEQRSTRGPRDVHIVLARDDRMLVDTTYDIDYERDEDFYGDEKCGFCDLQEQRANHWVEE